MYIQLKIIQMKKIKKLILPVSLGLLIFLTVINVTSCEDDDAVGDGSLCTDCNTNADCKDGMTCKFFYISTAMQTKSANLCAYSTTETCPLY